MSANDVDMDAELAQLLLEQEQFLKQKKPPAAKVSRRGSVPSVLSPESKKNASKLAPEEGFQVLKSVVERQVTPETHRNLQFGTQLTGFPVATRRSPGQSLFGRRRREAKTQDQEEETKKHHMDPESRDIDAANRAKLQEMSTQEILEAQKELLGSLDPELVKKLKNRRKKTENIEEVRNESFKTQVTIGESIVKNEDREKETLIKNLAAVKTEKELKEQEKLLTVEERAKLDWTQSISKNSRVSRKRVAQIAKEPTMERFDLNGKIVEATNADIPVHSGLFHHGDDPEIAGYTFPELLHLTRSSVASQRAMALNIVAKVLHNRQLQTLERRRVSPQVLPRNIVLTLRMVLDDQNYTALSAGVSALHAFIVPLEVAEDHSFTELPYGTILFPNKVHVHHNVVEKQGNRFKNALKEVIYIDTTENDDGTSISDEDLASLDPVQALLHMNLSTRLRYILETIQLPDQDATEKILDILITVARHSPRAAQEINSDAKLLLLLQRQFIENEQILTFESDNIQALQLSVKTLKLVRVLCQGERSVAMALLSSGLIQSTKGFLALKEVPTGNICEATNLLFQTLQVESLRIWRILLGYGLDFHCFAYLFPVLSDLLHHSTNAQKLALFKALEAFCALELKHEAQHYFSQLNYFLDVAKDEAIMNFRFLLTASEVLNLDVTMLLSSTLRFLTIATNYAAKYKLETAGVVQVLKLVQSSDVLKLLSRLTETIETRELLVAIVRFYMQTVHNDYLYDNVDDHDVRTFLCQVEESLLIAATNATTSSFEMNAVLIQACELVVLVEELDIIHFTDAFVRKMYHQALILVRRLRSGAEYWITQLFAQVLFHPKFFQRLEIFCDQAEANRMSHVLLPIYQALLNATRNQETHSMQLFTPISNIHKISCHLYLPQEEQSYVASNLPLPDFWVISPLSSIDYNSNDGNQTDTTRSQAQSNEMKLIVQTTCRFVLELERLKTILPAFVNLSSEDILFHLLYIFFAGSDILFDDYVDTALHQLLPKLITPIYQSNENLLFTGFLKNLKWNQEIESQDQVATSFASDERQLLTFVEKLVAEFTTTSFGNFHFAQCVTLLLTDDFPVDVRTFVWKELHESHLLHTLAPFKDAKIEILKRCTRTSDVKLVPIMQQIVCTTRVSPVRGAFVYTVAIHQLVMYLFAQNDGNTFGVARQQLIQTLLNEASPTIWGHLLSYNVVDISILSESHDVIQIERVKKLRSQALLSSDQLLTFDATISLLCH
ncbi:putative RNA polymerase II-associated protein [Plasmopara halstedii]